MAETCKPDFCSRCPINHVTRGYVPPQVKPTHKLLVGEAAGENEANSGVPFVGKAGMYLNTMLKKADQPRDQWNVINVIGCQPPGNVFPGSDAWTFTDKKDALTAVDYCRQKHLLPFLRSKQWEKVVALGGEALKATTNRTGISIWRGSPLPANWRGDKKPLVMPVYHPSYIGRMSQFYGISVNDLKKSLVVPEITRHFNDTSALTTYHPQRFAFDLEWDAQGNITICGISDKPHEAWVFAWDDRFIPYLKNLFENATDLIGWNIVSADLPHFERLKWNITAKLHDTMLKQHLVQPDFRHSLAFASSVFTNAPFWKGRAKTEDDESAEGVAGAPEYKTWDKAWAIPISAGGYGGCTSEEEAFYLYNAYDTCRSYEIEFPIDMALKQMDMEHVYWDVSLPVALICREITRDGWKLDSSRIASIQAELDEKIQRLDKLLPEGLRTYLVDQTRLVDAPPNTYKPKTKKCRKCKAEVLFESPGDQTCACGAILNSGNLNTYKKIRIPVKEQVIPWNSPAAIKEYAMAQGLKPGTNAKTQADTVDQHIRQQWAKTNKEFAILNELTKAATLRKTFAKDALTNESRMYFNILVHGTAEGRVSSSGQRKGIDLNIQNQPKAIRKIYIGDTPEDGIYNHDYVSGENTLTAWFSQDYERLERMRSEPDFDEHAELGRVLFNCDCGKGTENEYLRRPAKIVNHGMGYGMGRVKLLSELHNAGFLHYTLADSREFIERWRVTNAKTHEWQKQVIAQVEKDGYLKNPFGRTRWFHSRDWAGKALAFLPASTLADITLRSMIALYPDRFAHVISRLELGVARALPSTWKLRCQVHDSLVTLGDDRDKDQANEVVSAVMSQPWKALGGFHLLVESEYSGKGGSWGDCK